jgi:hypothetical protein
MQNHSAYQRRNARRGSPVIPSIHHMIPSLAMGPVSLTTSISLIFHQPKLVIPSPLTWEAIVCLVEGDSHPSPAQLDIIHGLYLRLEQDTHDNHIHRFNLGDITCLRRDVGRELRAVIKLWVGLWKKEAMKWHETVDGECDESTIGFVHLQWTSRIVIGLHNELFLLGTVQRRRDYVSSIRGRRVEIPYL